MTNVRQYTDKEILDRIKSLPSFKGWPVGRFPVGIRSNEDETDVMDDKFFIYEYFPVGYKEPKFIKALTGTTNAGGSILKGGFRAYNSEGAFVLKADECFYDFWTYGLHRGKMPALIQVGTAIGFRDGNMNGKAEEIGAPRKGKFGINFHSNTYKFKLIGSIYKLLDKAMSKFIGGWSAGCQVINEREGYTEQINYFKQKKESGEQKYVSYFLLNEF